MENELRERIEKLERDQKAVRGRLHRGETLADRIWGIASAFGLLALLGGITNVVVRGVNEVNFAFILVGGLLTYRWHNQNKADERDREILDDINEELEAAGREFRAVRSGSPDGQGPASKRR